MRRTAALALVAFAISVNLLLAQASTTRSQPERKQSWFSRMLHPFGSVSLPEYRDVRLRGLVMEIVLSPEPVKLSEVRRLSVKATLTNRVKRPIELDFPNEQRIEILLLNSTGTVLTKWSDNHAFADAPGTVVINPQEHIEYDETIATRDLAPNKVFIAEVFFPRYPELRIRQKFLTAQ
ncbi:MAG: BsuPI-related putative proteinase inhibitor [Verrucomicrobiota bacterium]